MQKDLDDPYLVTTRATEADVDDTDPSDAGSSGMGRDFDKTYCLMVRHPKFVLIWLLMILMSIILEYNSIRFDHGMIGLVAILTILYFLLIAFLQLVAIPHAMWMMYKNGWLQSWRHCLVVFCGVAVLALGIFVNARLGILQALPRALLG
ncbi:MAG: hypothetical protein MUE46_09055 [Xanthomonadales bacterium]|jgi:hypothetical protein|nr:hypothetical protein [Xanthomonadales bacterium]